MSLLGVQRAYNHRFAGVVNEGNVGSIIRGPNGVDLGDNDFGDDGGFLQSNGLINVRLDISTFPTWASRPRARARFPRFGVFGNGMTGGTGIRVSGTMLCTLEDLDFSYLPDWAYYIGSRGDSSPGSANGNILRDLFSTRCGTAGVGGGGSITMPDGYVGQLQSGGNFGRGLHFSSCGNISAQQIHVWDNDEDNILFSACTGMSAHVMSYDGYKTNIAITGTRSLILTGESHHPNRSAQTTDRDSSTVYCDATSDEITIAAFRAAGDSYALRYEQYTAWTTLEAGITVGTIRVNANKRYTATTAGTTGATPPTHTTGTASDGGVTWDFDRGYGLKGLVFANPTGRLTLEGGGAFIRHRTQNYDIATPNVFGEYDYANSFSTAGGANINMFDAGEAGAVWRVRASRAGANTDGVIATVFGGAAPVIAGKAQSGTSVDLNLSGSTVRANNTTGGTFTMLKQWTRIK
ncbi:hypothetical protein [Allomesorhizobium camelthorni]|uniref:Uncharacterized protein n=1 Tax=Allomesorhizobium camelthorni TaxID=475069 RepID=A0A6G4WJC4_9HYPH|nr:hypothetical protein [Mesorhizobium camelthorni]NGO54220.1 hypothetical protein [Mesorhizobium camelthorni]